ncbi:MAG: PAS domain S-box protein [Candidatus Methanofastidiosia archaeon]
MIWQQTPFTIPLTVASAASIILGLHVLRHPWRGNKAGALIIFANTEWILGYALELSSGTVPAIIFWDKMQIIAIAILPTAWLMYSIYFTGQKKWLERRIVLTLMVAPLITVLLALTNDIHGLIWTAHVINTEGPYLVVNETYGSWFWFYVVYMSMLVLSGIILLIQSFIRSRQPYRWQAGSILFSVLIPLVATVLVLSRLNPFPYLNLIPVALVISNITIAISIIYFWLGDIVPLARETVIDHMHDGVIILDAEDRIVDLNSSAHHILGASIGSFIKDVWPEWPQVEKGSRKITADNEVVLGSEQRMYDVEISPLSDYHGLPMGRAVVLRDITDRRRVERAEKYRLLAENVRDVIWTMDMNLQFTYMSPSVKQLRGYTAEEVMTQSLDEVLTPSSVKLATEVFVEELAKISQGFIDANTTKTLELEHKCKDGSTVWAEVKMTGLFDVHGNLTGILGVSRDISERKKAEELLHESEEKFRKIFEQANDAIVLMDRYGTIRDLNKKCEEIFGYNRDEVIGKNFKDTGALNSENIRKAVDVTNHISKDKTSMPLTLMELELKHKNGTKIFTEVSVGFIKKKGRIEGILAILRDVTERKKAEEKISTSLKEKEVLLREIHHRVKNNIQIISSLLNLQSRYIEDKKYAEMLKESQDRIRSMALIHEKLYQSKNLGDIDFGGYIDTLVKALFRSYGVNQEQVVPTVSVEGVSLEIDYAIPCGLIINELVSNVLRHAFPDGRGEIMITLRSIGDSIELKISDNGVGIPEDIDFRNTKSLGLHLVTILVEDQLGGEIHLDRRCGTTFTITFKRSY